MKGLTNEDRDDLAFLRTASAYKALTKLFDLLLEEQVQDVLRVDLMHNNDRELILKKARVEGSKRLIKDLELARQRLFPSK